MSVAGKTAIVTGAGTGIGRATAQLLAERGARVVAAGLQPEALSETVEAITAAGAEAIAVDADVSDTAAIEHVAERAQDFRNGLAFDAAQDVPRAEPRARGVVEEKNGANRNHSRHCSPDDLSRAYGRDSSHANCETDGAQRIRSHQRPNDVNRIARQNQLASLGPTAMLAGAAADGGKTRLERALPRDLLA